MTKKSAKAVKAAEKSLNEELENSTIGALEPTESETEKSPELENEVPSANPVDEAKSFPAIDEQPEVPYASSDPSDLGMVSGDVLLPGQKENAPQDGKFHFGHALSYLLDGAKVARKSWHQGRYLKLVSEDGDGTGFIQDVRESDTQAFGFQLTQAEVLSQDWYVVGSEVENG